ncbi:diguanylate cyclase [Saccharopolyspora sp. K220]|uniref:diguanylate cyclase n=1 Tax=Saccharopolyspora soli TaxID=2926618 RepID=UPI001F580DBC|nr:diguanylate cyclase [Saccharopolyspora soli]MCI2420092.1 diguanylate cyclase [Saccharopolyspora soli]
MNRPLATSDMVDKLTGLPDRWSWDAHACHLLDQSRSIGEPVALLLADLDRFKAVNDTWGHLTGDAVLAGVADTLRRILAPDRALMGRYGGHGGDEFLVLLSRTDIERAIQIAEDIRRQIRELAITATATTGSQVLLTGMSVSIGVTSAPPDKDVGLAALVLAADAALQTAKRNGRDQTRTRASRLGTPPPTAPHARVVHDPASENPLRALSSDDCLQHLLNFSHMVASGHWNPDVLHALSSGPRRYTELREAIRTSTAVDGWSGRTRHIHSSILHHTLQRLERDGLVHRTEELGVWPRSVTYELTDAGHALLRAAMAGVLWSHHHQDLIARAQQRALATSTASLSDQNYDLAPT